MAKNYLDNKQFLKELTNYREKYIEAQKDSEKEVKIRIPDSIGIAMMDIATNLAKKPNFSGYDFKDEMIHDAVVNCLEYAHKFDPEKSDNPFSYFTQVTFYAFLRRIDKEKKKLYTQLKAQESLFMEIEADPNYKGNTQISESEKMFHEGMQDFIQKFEEKNFPIKSKKKPNNPLSDLLNSINQ